LTIFFGTNKITGLAQIGMIQEKLEKLKTKQFPLLYHKLAKSKFTTVAIDQVSQALCLLVLFIPYEYRGKL
jgi:hypothetical protein